MKTIIILICIIIVLLTALTALIFFFRKTRNSMLEATAALQVARASLEDCAALIKKDLSAHLNTVDKGIENLLKNAENRFNNNASTIGDKLTQHGFEVEKK
jgi:hypothetical protein